jgi:hypothetical protein
MKLNSIIYPVALGSVAFGTLTDKLNVKIPEPFPLRCDHVLHENESLDVYCWLARLTPQALLSGVASMAEFESKNFYNSKLVPQCGQWIVVPLA